MTIGIAAAEGRPAAAGIGKVGARIVAPGRATRAHEPRARTQRRGHGRVGAHASTQASLGRRALPG